MFNVNLECVFLAHSFNGLIMKKLCYIPKRKLDVFGIGAGISAAGQVASSIYAADKQFEATRETNDLNKQLAEQKNALDYQTFTEANEFNRIEAEKQRAHAESLAVRSERYNSLENQVAQARRAGISPAAVAGGTQTSVGIASPGAAAQSAPAPVYTAAHMQTPDLSALQGISSAFGNFSQGMLNAEQAKKVRAETSGQLTLNKWIDKEKAAGVYKDRSEAAKNFALVRQADQSVKTMKEQVNEIRSKIALTNEQTFNQNVKNAFESKQMEYATKILAEQLKISQVNAKKVAATLLYDILGVKLQNEKLRSDIVVNQSQAGLNNAKANESRVTAKYIPLEWLNRYNVSQADVKRLQKVTNLLKTQDDQAIFDLGVDEDFKELEKSLGSVGTLLKIAKYFMDDK